MSSDPSRTIEAAFPVIYSASGGTLRLSCLGADSPAAEPTLVFEVEVLDDSGEIRESCRQAVALRWLEARDGDELARRALDRLRGVGSVEYVIFPAHLLAPPYRPLDARDIADADAYAIYDRLAAQAHVDFAERFARLDVWPAAARTLYFLVIAHSQLGGKGFEVYLAQAPYEEILGVLDALDTGGVERLAERMRQGIAVCAEEGGAEFLDEVDDDWLESTCRSIPQGEDRVWGHIDSHDEGGTWWLVREELAPAMERYASEHRAELTA